MKLLAPAVVWPVSACSWRLLLSFSSSWPPPSLAPSLWLQPSLVTKQKEWVTLMNTNFENKKTRTFLLHKSSVQAKLKFLHLRLISWFYCCNTLFPLLRNYTAPVQSNAVQCNNNLSVMLFDAVVEVLLKLYVLAQVTAMVYYCVLYSEVSPSLM